MKTGDNPLISVITITRNREKLISRAIDSVLNQTYRHFEYIIVDGASTDNTVFLVKSFDDPRIKLISLNENLSISETISIGVEKSIGEFITFLDDDDEYLPTKLEKQLNLILRLDKSYGFVYCWMDYYDSRTNDKVKEHRPVLRGFIPEQVVEMPIVSGTPTLFFRRNAFVKLGGWKGSTGIISDWELAARACQKYKVDYVSETLVNVYINHGAIRMSDRNYYNNLLEKTIIFHKHFLTEFNNIFEQYPQKKNNHLYNIARSYFLLGQFEKGWGCYKELIKSKVKIKYLLLLPYCFFYRAFQNG